jgi:hypothetical protein
VIGFQLLDRECSCFHGRRCQRLEKGIGYILVDGKTTDIETFSTMSPVALLTTTIVAGRRVCALIGDMQPTSSPCSSADPSLKAPPAWWTSAGMFASRRA